MEGPLYGRASASERQGLCLCTVGPLPLCGRASGVLCMFGHVLCLVGHQVKGKCRNAHATCMCTIIAVFTFGMVQCPNYGQGGQKVN